MKKYHALIWIFIAALGLQFVGNIMFKTAESDVLTIPNRWEPGDPRRPYEFSENYDTIENWANGNVGTFNLEDGGIMNVDVNATAAITDTKFGCATSSDWGILSDCDGIVSSADSQHTHAAIADGLRFIDYATGSTPATATAYLADDALVITLTNKMQAYASGAFGCMTWQSVDINGTELYGIATHPVDFVSISTHGTGNYALGAVQTRMIYDTDKGFSSSTAYTITAGTCHVTNFGGAGACNISYPNDNHCGLAQSEILVEGY